MHAVCSHAPESRFHWTGPINYCNSGAVHQSLLPVTQPRHVTKMLLIQHPYTQLTPPCLPRQRNSHPDQRRRNHLVPVPPHRQAAIREGECLDAVVVPALRTVPTCPPTRGRVPRPTCHAKWLGRAAATITAWHNYVRSGE